MHPSRRDSNRTKEQFLRLSAVQSKRVYGENEEQFVSNLKPEFQELARKIYREVHA